MCQYTPRFAVAIELQPLQLVDAQGFEGLLDHGRVFQPPQTTWDVVLAIVDRWRRRRCCPGGVGFDVVRRRTQTKLPTEWQEKIEIEFGQHTKRRKKINADPGKTDGKAHEKHRRKAKTQTKMQGRQRGRHTESSSSEWEA